MQRRGIVAHFAERPAQLLIVTFFLTIVVGMLLLSLPLAVRGEGSASLVDALFTSTSAVCVTGLIVQDTPVYFSEFGLVVIMVLIQIGGLGIMTISSSVALALKRGMAIKHRVVMQQMMDQTYYEELQEVLKRIVWGTFLIEAVGTMILTAAWYDTQTGFATALWRGMFHAVSAFCNAGFALFSDSLMGFQHSPLILTVHMALIVIGGLGFTIIGPLLSFKLPRGNHARLTVIITALLLVGGFIFFFVVEGPRGMIDQALTTKFWNALFQSVTARTAGFNSVDLTTWSNASIVLFFILMFVGASPGSTGGGIKTTTLGVLVLSVISMVRGRDDVEFHGRRLPQEIIIKAIAIMLLSLTLIYTFVVILMLTETATFKSIMFEVASAFGTVGLSLGLTPALSVVGKVLISVLMFFGRVGPLTAAMLVGERMVRASYRYPVERVMVG